MSDVLDRIRERTRQLRETQRARMDAAIADARQRAAARDGRHPIGARVFDVVSGQEGEVVGRTRENVIDSTRAR
jgi:tRNA(Arg) A34 adenosine deaminase TadA